MPAIDRSRTIDCRYLVQGVQSLESLQQLCAADVDTDLGKLTYTGMLNQHGGYEADVTVTRLGEQKFMVVSGTAQATKDIAWMRRQIGTLGLNAVSKNDEFCIKNEEFCIKNEGFCYYKRGILH